MQRTGSSARLHVTGPGYTWADLCTEVSMVPAIREPELSDLAVQTEGTEAFLIRPRRARPGSRSATKPGSWRSSRSGRMQPITYERIRQNLPFAGVTMRTLYLMGAMRADVVVDFNSAGYADGDIAHPLQRRSGPNAVFPDAL